MATKSTRELFEALRNLLEPHAKCLVLDQKIPGPDQDPMFWPQADIVVYIDDDTIAIIEVDDHGDPGRSIVKYWPLIHAIDEGSFSYPKIKFIEVFAPDATFGRGYGILAQFIGSRLSQAYPDCFQFCMIHKASKTGGEIAREIQAFLPIGR